MPNTPLRLTRRSTLTFLAASVAGCGNSRFASIAQTLGDELGGPEPLTLDRAQIDRSPYARLMVRIEGSGAAVLVLADSGTPDRMWVASDRANVQTRGPRLVATAGLQRNRRRTLFPQPDPLEAPGKAVADGSGTIRQVALSGTGYHALTVRGELRVRGAEDVTIAERTYTCVRIEESCTAPEAGYSFTNTFWLDPERPLAWKSRQWVHPALERFEIAMLKPPAAS